MVLWWCFLGVGVLVFLGGWGGGLGGVFGFFFLGFGGVVWVCLFLGFFWGGVLGGGWF